MGWLARMGPVKPAIRLLCGQRPTGENTSIQIAGFDIARQAEQARPHWLPAPALLTI